MKAILENYSSNLTTEPLYFSECLNRIGSQGMLWSPQEISIYDAYDIMQPDVIVVSLKTISLDIFKLLKGSETKLVVNNSNSSEEEVVMLCKAIKSNDINCPFIFSDTCPNDTVEGVNRVNILKGADIFLQKQNDNLPQYSIDAAFVVDSPQESIEFDGSYHVLSQYTDRPADIQFPIHTFYALCKRYKEIIVNQSVEDGIPQSFFDAHLYETRLQLLLIKIKLRSGLATILKSLSNLSTCAHIGFPDS